MAIAFGAISSVSTLQTPTSVSVSGSDTVGIVHVSDGTGVSNEITAVTWDGVSMTKIGEVQTPGARWQSVWWIVNPTSSATISFTGGSYWRSFNSYYTGAHQTAPIDSSNTGTSSASTFLSISTTVVVSGCWLIMVQADSTGGKTYSASNDISIMRANADAGGIASADSNGTVATGSRTATLTATGSTTHAGITFSLAPAPVVSTFIPKVIIF